MGLDGPQAGSALGKRNVLGYCPCCSVIPFPHFPLLSPHSSPVGSQRSPETSIPEAVHSTAYSGVLGTSSVSGAVLGVGDTGGWSLPSQPLCNA